MQIEHKDATITNVDETFPGTFEVILSTPDLDRDGDTFLTSEWETPLPEKITFDMDHGMSVATTVGSGVPSFNADGQLVVSGTYSSLKQAQDVRTLVNEGHIDRTSVAYVTHRKSQKGGPTQVSRELLNGAFVAIPANNAAKVLASKGIKAGARNSTSDAAKIQKIHDLALELGAEADGGVPDDKKSFRAQTKAVAGSLEATQERASDALNDAYGTDAWVWLQATLPEVLVFQISANDGSENETYQQSYTDDGSVVTLTGERAPVDLVQVIKPDPDEDAEPATSADLAAAEKSPAATPDTKAAAVDSDAVTAEQVEAKALEILAESFI